jgi:transcriptional regulator with XRE-family HTH domain
MHKSNIAYSVFADTCGIARPTLSQLLTGRNKKVSDEIISKIHKAYPRLSIMWLMFGEGAMLNLTGPNENKLVSSKLAENSKNSTLFDNGLEDLNHDHPTTIDFNDEQERSYEERVEAREKSTALMGVHLVGPNVVDNGILKNDTVKDRKIAKVLIIYDDNSFHQFVPTVM